MSLPKPYYQDDAVTIYHADCREILPHLEPVDLVLTDPPYGLNYRAHTPNAKEFDVIHGDDSEPDLAFLFSLSCNDKVVFGANCFPRQLPHRGRWICWDKRVDPKADKMLGSPFELAWTSKTSGYDKIVRLMHGGVVNADHRETDRLHPTQKPTGLIKSILAFYPKAQTILDPFMGSGTTLRAAKDLGRKAIGIEIEEKYCEIAVKRMRQEVLPLMEQTA